MMSEALRKELLEWAITMLKVGGPEYDSRDVLEVLEQLQAALAEPEQSEPVMHITKTVVGNHLRKNKNGDIEMYRNGFKDGVQFAVRKLQKVSHD